MFSELYLICGRGKWPIGPQLSVHFLDNDSYDLEFLNSVQLVGKNAINAVSGHGEQRASLGVVLGGLFVKVFKL